MSNLSPSSSRDYKRNFLIIASLALQIVFLNSISGVDINSNLRILSGLAVQTSLGILLVRVFFAAPQFSLPGLLSAGFVLGVIPVLSLGFQFSPLVLFITTLLALASVVRRRRSSRQCRLVFQDSSTHDNHLVMLSVVITLSNLVFLRLENSVAGFVVLLLSVLLVLLPKRYLIRAHWCYLFLILLVTVQSSSQTEKFQTLTKFRYGDDWVIEQVLARSTSHIFPLSLENPFFLGDSLGYHFLSQLYWGRFESAFEITVFAFSGPALLSSTLMAALFLLLDSRPRSRILTDTAPRLIVAAVMFGSWSFSDTFALDMFSRSHSLSLAMCALAIRSVSENSKWVRLLLTPILLTMTALTKVSTGLFLFLFLGCHVVFRGFVTYRQEQKNLLGIGEFRTQMFGVLVTALAVLGALLWVFSGPNSLGSYSGLAFELSLPDLYDTSRSIAKWIQSLLAFLPVITLVAVGLNLYNGVREHSADLVDLAQVAAATLVVITSLTLSSQSGISFTLYMFALAAVVSGPILLNALNQFWLHPTRHLTLLLTVLGLALFFAFTLLERRNQPSRLGFEAIVAISVVALLGVALLTKQLKSVRLALVSVTVLLSFTNSLAKTAAGRTTGQVLTSQPTQLGDSKLQAYQNTLSFLEDSDNHSVFATDSGGSYSALSPFTHDVQILLTSVPIRMWAEPKFSAAYLGNSDAVANRLKAQRLLTGFPTPSRVGQAKALGVTHLILFQLETQAAWKKYLRNQELSVSGKRKNSTIVFEDSGLQIIEL